MNRGVKAPKSDPGVGAGQAPVDGASPAVGFGLPEGNFAVEVRPVLDARAETLTPDGTAIDLGHVEPEAVFGVKWNSRFRAILRASASTFGAVAPPLVTHH